MYHHSFIFIALGMSPEETHLCLSFGHCNKEVSVDYTPIGHYGNGFKSGSMRIGKNAIVLTKNGETKTVAMLSQAILYACLFLQSRLFLKQLEQPKF